MGKIIIMNGDEFKELEDKKNVEVAGFVRDIKPHPKDMKRWIKEEKKQE